MKQRKLRKGLYLWLCSMVMTLLFFTAGMESYAYTSDDVPGVDFSDDEQVWTVAGG